MGFSFPALILSRYEERDDRYERAQLQARLGGFSPSLTRGRFGRTRRPVSLGLGSFVARLAATSSQYVRCLCLGHAAVYSDLSMIYLIKLYMLTLALLAAPRGWCDVRHGGTVASTDQRSRPRTLDARWFWG